MNAETSNVTFQPNEFYERLLVMRDTNPAGLARLSSATLATLQAYEAAKLKVTLDEMKQQASAKPDDGDTKTPNAA